MNLSLAFADGMTAALQKFAVSGAMYARALQGAAQRRGGMFPAGLASEISAMPRPSTNPYWRQATNEVARIPGATMPSQEKLQHQAYLDLLPRGAPFGQTDARTQLHRRALMDLSGHQYPGTPGAATPAGDMTLPFERTTMGKRPRAPQ